VAHKLTDFRKGTPPGRADRGLLPSPGRAPDENGEGGACPQPAPRLASDAAQEPGVPRPAAEHYFEPGSGSHDRPAVHALVGITEAARQCGISKSVLADWCAAGIIVEPRHEHPSDKRKSKCWTTGELAALIECLAAHSLIVRHKGQWQKTRLKPGGAFTAQLAGKYSQLWADESRARTDHIQGDGQFRAVLLDEVQVWTGPAGEQAVRLHPAEPEVVPYGVDFRRWFRPGAPPLSSSRRRRRGR
jgi:hypothetical protein